MTTLLTTGGLAKVSGYKTHQVRTMADSGILIPVEGDEGGHGNHRFFSTMHALGLAYTMQWADWTTPREAVEAVCDFLVDLGESKLLDHFAKGRTHLMPSACGNMHLIEWGPEPEAGECFDVKRAYDNLMEAMSEMEEANEGIRIGRAKAIVK